MPTRYLDTMLGQNEKILVVTHQHWLVFLRDILLELAFIILLLIGSSVGLVLFPLAWLGYLLVLLPLASLGIDLLQWQNRQFVVTNRRVIQLHGVVDKSVTDSSLEKVNDVKLEQSAFGRLFGYGDVEILTASELGANLFRRIANPVGFKTAMLNAKERLESGEGRARGGDDIPAMIEQLDNLRKK